RAWHARDREDSLDEAQADQPRDGRDEGIEGGEERCAEKGEDDEALRTEAIAQRSRVTAQQRRRHRERDERKADEEGGGAAVGEVERPDRVEGADHVRGSGAEQEQGQQSA